MSLRQANTFMLSMARKERCMQLHTCRSAWQPGSGETPAYGPACSGACPPHRPRSAALAVHWAWPDGLVSTPPAWLRARPRPNLAAARDWAAPIPVQASGAHPAGLAHARPPAAFPGPAHVPRLKKYALFGRLYRFMALFAESAHVTRAQTRDLILTVF